MDKKKITVKTFLLQENGTVDKERFAFIQFRNQGETPATVQGNILLQPGESVQIPYIEPYVVFDQTFIVRFVSQSGKRNEVCVIAGVLI